MNVFDLVAKISLDSSEYNKGLDDANKSADNFKTKFGNGLKTAGKVGVAALTTVAVAGGAVAKSMYNDVTALAEYGDNIDKMSQKMGLSAEAYQEWDAVMQHSGTSIDAMQRGMTTLSKAAENGSDAFERLGISQEELASMSQEEIFAKTIEGLQNMEAGTERTALAQKLLGGSAKELGALLNTSAAETQAMKDRVHELGGVMSDEAVKSAAQFQDNMQDLQTAISGVKRGVVSDFLPAANDLISGFTMLISGEEGAEEQLSKGMDNLVIAVSGGLDKITQIGEKLFPKIAEAITKLLPKLVELGAKIIVQLAQGIISNAPSMIGSLVSALTSVLQAIATDLVPILPDIAIELVFSLVDALIDNLDVIIDAGLKIIVGLTQGIVNAIPKLVNKIPEVITKLIDALTKNIPQIADAGVEIFVALVKNLPAIISGIVKAIPQIIGAILGSLGSLIPGLSEFFQGAWDVIVSIWEGATEWFSNLWESIKEVFSVVIEWFGEIFQGAWDTIVSIWEIATEWFSGVWEGIVGVFSGVGEWFSGIFQGAWDGIQNIWSAVTGFFSGIWSGITGIFSGVASWFSGIFSSAFNAVTSIWSAITGFFSGVWNTIVGIFKDAGVAVGDAISGAVKGAVNAVLKGATGIINGFISAINLAISVINAIPGVKISKLEKLSAPALEEGIGLAQKGKQYLLEGKGNEAVVPIDKDLKWTNKVAGDMLMALSRQGLALGGQSGDIIIPVYIGNDRIQEIVVKANKINDYRSGGVA